MSKKKLTSVIWPLGIKYKPTLQVEPKDIDMIDVYVLRVFDLKY